jgi:SAM-dependent methyltransferase
VSLIEETRAGEYARYYDLLYEDKDYAGEAQYVCRLLSRDDRPPPGTLLELGCGTGLHASFLAEAGIEVLGIDLSAAMLASAGRRMREAPASVADRLSFRQGDARSFRVEQTFDAVVSLFHVASYQTRNEDIEGLFATASAHLRPGGLFVFDFWYGPAVINERPLARAKRVRKDDVSLVRFSEPVWHPDEDVVEVHHEVIVEDKATMHRFSKVHRMRYFFLPALALMMNRHELEAVDYLGWLTEEPPTPSTWSACCVARKRG